MSGSSAPMSWRECRAFLVELDHHATRTLAGERVPHVETCSACAARLKAAAAQVEILRSLPRVVVPGRLSSPQFLEGIYARAGEASETRLRPVLEEVLAETVHAVPAETDWLPAEDPQEIATSLARSLPSGPTPGWLWTRVQAEVRTMIRDRRSARWSRRVQVAGLLAAGLLVSVLALRPFLADEDEEPAFAEITFATVTTPLDSSYSFGLRDVGERR